MTNFSGQSGQIKKTDVIQLLLEQEGRVMLCLDATHPGVEVPKRFAQDIGLRLILNKTMPQPIYFYPATVESELRFGGVPHYCVIPYDALWAIYNPDKGQGMLWPESMPETIRERYLEKSSSEQSADFSMEVPLPLVEPLNLTVATSSSKSVPTADAVVPTTVVEHKTGKPTLTVIATDEEDDPPPTPSSRGKGKASRPKLTLIRS